MSWQSAKTPRWRKLAPSSGGVFEPHTIRMPYLHNTCTISHSRTLSHDVLHSPVVSSKRSYLARRTQSRYTANSFCFFHFSLFLCPFSFFCLSFFLLFFFCFFFFLSFLFLLPLKNKYAGVLDIGEGQQWKRARRIYPKVAATGGSAVAVLLGVAQCLVRQ